MTAATRCRARLLRTRKTSQGEKAALTTEAMSEETPAAPDPWDESPAINPERRQLLAAVQVRDTDRTGRPGTVPEAMALEDTEPEDMARVVTVQVVTAAEGIEYDQEYS